MAVFLMCTDTEEKAQALRAAMDLMLSRFGKGERGTLPTAKDVAARQFTSDDQAHLAPNRHRVVRSTPAQVHAQLAAD